ncbi:MAG: rhomboid family intramembrane serine protease [Armatimonadetes bacterium]|nr:rhomboid family intramembrane serine protease [Armatimonadota bacterium]
MIPIRDNVTSKELPLVTWTLVVLNVLIFFWDRGGLAAGGPVNFADLAVRPSEVFASMRGQGDAGDLTTLFTYMFLHGNLAHLVGNMFFLLAFGVNVESVFGALKFALFYLFWGLVAAFAEIYVHPGSMTSILGASGAIGGVLGAYLLLFPGNKITFIVFPLFWWPLKVTAWLLLGFWFMFQIFFPQEGVANWAHAGGFAAGMATVLLLGGRVKLLRGVALEVEADDED